MEAKPVNSLILCAFALQKVKQLKRAEIFNTGTFMGYVDSVSGTKMNAIVQTAKLNRGSTH